MQQSSGDGYDADSVDGEYFAAGDGGDGLTEKEKPCLKSLLDAVVHLQMRLFQVVLSDDGDDAGNLCLKSHF